MLSAVRATTTCRVRSYTIVCVFCGGSSFEHGLSPSSIYTHILSAHNHVIIMSYLRHCYILTGYYVFALKHIKMKEKKLDISPFLYITLMIIIFVLAL